jgi:hypothetical protein
MNNKSTRKEEERGQKVASTAVDKNDIATTGETQAVKQQHHRACVVKAHQSV